MAIRFTRGSLFSDGATPPAAKALTTLYVAGDEIQTSHAVDLHVHCSISGTAPTSVDLQLEASIDHGTSWEVVPIPGNESITADAILRFQLKAHTFYRFSAKRTGGAADTALLALGLATQLDAAALPLDQDGNVVVATAGSSTVAVEGDVAHDAVDSGNPVKTGFRARATQIAAVGDDDRSDAIANVYGEQVIAGYDWTTDAVRGDITDLGGNSINVNGGNRDTGTQTVTLADDDPATVSLGVMDDWDNAASDGASVSGDTAHDDADAGEPVKIGGRAHTGTPAAVANNDRVNAYFDEYGRLHVYDENGASAAAGDVAHDAVDSGNPVKTGFRARTSQIAAVANDDRSDAVSNEYGEQAVAGYDWTLESNRVNETNPLSEQHAADEFEEAAIVSGATYYHYIDMGGYSHLTITGNNTPGTDGQTITLEATCQDDGTAPGSIAAADWIDITQYGVEWLTGAAAASNTTGKFGWSVIDSARFKYVRIKYVIGAGAGNDAAHDIYARPTAL